MNTTNSRQNETVTRTDCRPTIPNTTMSNSFWRTVPVVVQGVYRRSERSGDLCVLFDIYSTGWSQASRSSLSTSSDTCECRLVVGRSAQCRTGPAASASVHHSSICSSLSDVLTRVRTQPGDNRIITRKRQRLKDVIAGLTATHSN